MDKNFNHELAIAYAHAKLIKRQQDIPEESGYDSELRSFLKSYYYALNQIPLESADMEDHF